MYSYTINKILGIDPNLNYIDQRDIDQRQSVLQLRAGVSFALMFLSVNCGGLLPLLLQGGLAVPCATMLIHNDNEGLAIIPDINKRRKIQRIFSAMSLIPAAVCSYYTLSKGDHLLSYRSPLVLTGNVLASSLYLPAACKTAGCILLIALAPAENRVPLCTSYLTSLVTTPTLKWVLDYYLPLN